LFRRIDGTALVTTFSSTDPPRKIQGSSRKCLWTVLLVFLVVCSSGCRHAQPEPVTLTFMDPEWSHDQSRRSLLSEANLREFEQQFGVKVKHLPAPETSQQQLAVMQDLLRKEGPIDVYGETERAR